MSNRDIANIIYNLSLDMDYADGLDEYNLGISILETEIRELKEKDKSLFYVLDAIACENQNMMDWAITRHEY